MAERLLVVSRQGFAVVFDPDALGTTTSHQMRAYEYLRDDGIRRTSCPVFKHRSHTGLPSHFVFLFR